MEPGEEHIDEIRDVPIALRRLPQIGNRQHAADGDRVDGLGLRYQTGIIRCGKTARRIGTAGRLVERYGEKMQAVIAFEADEQRRRLACNKSERGNLAAAQFVERDFLAVVCHGHRYLQHVEQPARGDRCAAAAHIDIHLLVGEVGEFADLRPGQQVKFLVVEPRDVSQRHLDAWHHPLLFRVFEHVALHDGHVDAAQVFEIGQILQRSFADDRHDAPRRAIIDQIGEVFGDPDRDAGGAGCFQLDHAAVDRRHPLIEGSGR